MLINIHPKLPMRSKAITRAFYIEQLAFEPVGNNDYEDYLMLRKDAIEIHFFSYPALDPAVNDGQVYIRVQDIESWYRFLINNKVEIHPNGALALKPWGQNEFSLLDPDNNLLSFGEAATV